MLRIVSNADKSVAIALLVDTKNTGTDKEVNQLSHIKMRYCVRICPEKTRMWANAQRDCRPAEYRWRPLFNAAKFG